MAEQGLSDLCQQLATTLSVGDASQALHTLLEPYARASEAVNQQQEALAKAVQELKDQEERRVKAVEAVQQQQEVLLKAVQACSQQQELILKAVQAAGQQALKQQARTQQQATHKARDDQKEAEAKQPPAITQPTNAKQQVGAQQAGSSRQASAGTQQTGAKQQAGAQQQQRDAPFRLLKCVQEPRAIRHFTVTTEGKGERALPIVTIHLQTTGLSTDNDRVIEFTAIKQFPEGTVVRVGPQRVLTNRLISQKAHEVHGLTQANLVGAPTFAQCAPELHRFMFEFGQAGDIVLNAYNNTGFFLPLLQAEFGRVGMNIPAGVVLQDPMLWAIKDFVYSPTLKQAYSYYCVRTLPLRQVPSSLDKARAAHQVLLAQVRRQHIRRQGVPEGEGMVHATETTCMHTPRPACSCRDLPGDPQPVGCMHACMPDGRNFAFDVEEL